MCGSTACGLCANVQLSGVPRNGLCCVRFEQSLDCIWFCATGLYPHQGLRWIEEWICARLKPFCFPRCTYIGRFVVAPGRILEGVWLVEGPRALLDVQFVQLYVNGHNTPVARKELTVVEGIRVLFIFAKTTWWFLNNKSQFKSRSLQSRMWMQIFCPAHQNFRFPSIFRMTQSVRHIVWLSHKRRTSDWIRACAFCVWWTLLVGLRTQQLFLLELEVGANGVEAKERDRVGHDPVVDEAAAVEVGRRPPAVLLVRRFVVQRVQLEFLNRRSQV